MTIEQLNKENGYIKYDGKPYVLLRQAHIDGPLERPYFAAKAIAPCDGPDYDGMYTVYNVTWYPLQSWLDGDREDEGDACDWDNPDEVEETLCGYELEADRIV